MTVSLTLSFFPVRSLFVIFSFLLTMASFRFVRFAHGANLRTLACRFAPMPCTPRLSLQSNGTVNRLSHFSVYIRQDGITRISPILPCVLFPYISGFIASAFIRLVRFAVLRQTCAPSHCRFAPMPCMFPSFAPNSRKQRLIALFLPFGAKDGIRTRNNRLGKPGFYR